VLKRLEGLTSIVSRGSSWRCKLQVCCRRESVVVPLRGTQACHPTGRQETLCQLAPQNKQRALACWLAKFQGGQWARGGSGRCGDARRARPKQPSHQSQSSIGRLRAEGTPVARENHGQRHPQLCFGPVVSDHHTSPGLVDNCHFILSLFYKFACLVPSTRGPASTLPVC
jgi:hypothetical protein